MKQTIMTATAASALALAVATPAFAQEDVQVLSNWAYDGLYAEGWSVDTAFGTTEVVDATGEDIGDIENIIFSNEGEVLGIIAQVGGFWDIGDTHVHVPWDEITMTEGTQQIQVPVTEETIDDYDVFDGNWEDEQVITEDATDSTQVVDDDLVAGSGIFKATDLIGSYAYLSEDVPYGYVADIIVQNDAIAAIVTDSTAYGRAGYYAYPYRYTGTSPMGTTRYDMQYDATEVDTIESFDYEQLQ
ncbi:PRC-barrel domain-containing protein, partial [Loktanella sp. SALINAS62]|uniref:PRC-barrel domain-containing protein n=1 Tax=Loktanella sp. SALINAS62 TaxID=2706124 RepID=UPI001B8B77F6